MLVAVNVDVALYDGDRWLLIVRGEGEEHAAGMLSLVGGTLEAHAPTSDIVELTARREVEEEVGVRLTGPLDYVESTFFVADEGTPVLNVVMVAGTGGQLPRNNAPREVAAVVWRTLGEVAADPACPPWTLQSLQRAAAVLGGRRRG